MEPTSDSDPTSVLLHRLTLEEAVEHCVLALESTGNVDPKQLISQFPQWTDELAEFLEDWGAIEQFAFDSSNQLEQEPGQAGQPFGDYELIGKIGIGGMGVIYKARHVKLDRIVALKMVIGHRPDRDRFRIETEAAAALSHPNIVSIYEIGEHQGRLFFSMQLVEGCNLKEYLGKRRVTPKEAAKITETIARAVHYAHQRGILHRDLKPANVLMDVDGQPHITDFGLAKQIERDTEITRTGVIMGTPGYMAPEQASGKNKNLTTATDVYGLGAILYALLTGDAPFTGDSSLVILRRVVDEPPTSPRVRDPGIHRDIETICLKCLEKSPELRYASSDLLADDLSRFLMNRPVKARPVSPGERFWRWCRRNPAVTCLSGAVVVLLLATTVTLFFLALSQNRTQELSSKVSSVEQNEKKALNLVDQTRSNLYLSNGLSQARQANHGEAVFWFAEAANLTRDDPVQFRAHLTRHQNWMKSQPTLLGAIWLKPVYDQPGRRRSGDRIQFRPGATQMLCDAGSEHLVWDYVKGDKWALDEFLPDVSTSRWSHDGNLLAIGAVDGRVLLVDPDVRETIFEFRLEDRISHLAFSKEHGLIAVASLTQVRIWDIAEQRFIGNELVCPRNVAHIIFDNEGDRLVLVHHGKIANVYAIDGELQEDQSFQKVFEVPCLIETNSEGRQAFWPKFVNNDELLIIKSNTKEINSYDPGSGAQLGKLDLPSSTYSTAVSSDGKHLILSGLKAAEVLKLVEVPDLAEDGLQEEPIPTDSDQTPSFAWETVDQLGHDDRVVTADFSSTKLIATGSWDQQVRLWRAPEPPIDTDVIISREPCLVALPHQTRVRQVKFSPDGSILATVQLDGLIRLWRTPDYDSNGYAIEVNKGGSLAKLVDHHRWYISGMSRWSAQVANITVYQNETGDISGGTTGLTLENGAQIMDACCAPEANQLVTAHAAVSRKSQTWGLTDGRGCHLRFWTFPECEPLHPPLPMPSEPRWVAYHPNGRQVAVCTARMEIVLVNTETFMIEDILVPLDNEGNVFKPRSLHATHQFNQQLAYSPDGRTIVASSLKSDILSVWDVESRQPRFPRIGNDGWPTHLPDFSPDGTRMAMAGGRNPVARVMDVETGEFVVPTMEHSAPVFTARFSPDGERIVTACRDGQARVFDSETGEMILSDLTHDGDVYDAVYTPDSRFILTLGLDHELRVWNAHDGSLAIRPLHTPPKSRQILVTPDSRFAIVGGGQYEIRVFDLERLFEQPDVDFTRLIKLSELMASKTMSDNGAPINLSTSEWYSKWLDYSRETDAR